MKLKNFILVLLIVVFSLVSISSVYAQSVRCDGTPLIDRDPMFNQLPLAILTSNATDIFIGDSVLLDGNASFDPDEPFGFIQVYEWDFGDGTRLLNSRMPIVSHTYNAVGSYLVNLTVYDNECGNDSAQLTINVFQTNLPPIADAGPDQEVNLSEVVSLDGSNSTDPDGTIVSYMWDFGDGSVGVGVNNAHVYRTPGTYTVTLTVTDNFGAIDTDTAIVNVKSPDVPVNPPPVITIPTPVLIPIPPRNVPPVVPIPPIVVPTPVVPLQPGVPLVPPMFHEPKSSKNFKINRVMALGNKVTYQPGELIPVVIKITNEGPDEKLDLKAYAPQFNNLGLINSWELDSSQIDWLVVYLKVPQDLNSGLYLVKFDLKSHFGERRDIRYLELIIA